MATFAVGARSRVCSLPDCQRACFEDQDGAVHNYCSLTCSHEAVQRAKWMSLRGRSSGTSHAPRCKRIGCSRTVHIDERQGRVHDFCGRRHANEAMTNNNGEGSSPSRRNGAGSGALAGAKGTAECHVEGCTELVYRDLVTGVDSNYCSKRHYVMGMVLLNKECIRDGCCRAAWVDEDTGGVLDYCGSRCADQVGMHHLKGSGKCSLPGCVVLNFVHPLSKQELGYCCEDHRLRATQRSLGPNSEPFIDRTFRGGTTSADDFRLSVLTNMHPEYLGRKQQFMQMWEKPFVGSGVSVLRMFKVKVPEDVRRRAEDHMGQVGNVRRRFHGTSCSDICTFFVDLRGGPCGESACNVCSICTHGFKLGDNIGTTARRKNFQLRYGDGLYFSSVSGKANDYAELSEKTDRSGKRVRCMFLSSVAVGKPFRTFEGQLPPALCPPPGFDSVLGERGQHLNYPEDVVYREEAALPTHLIVYSLHD